LSLTLASQLWGLLLPVPFSDELYRGGQLAASDTPLGVIARAAFLDRVTTLVVTAVLGLCAAILNRSAMLDERLIATLAAAAAAPFLGYVLLRRPVFARFALSPVRRVLPPARFQEVEHGVAWLLAHPGALLVFLGLAAGGQLVFVAAMTEWAQGLGVPLSVEQIAWAMLASALVPYLLPLPGMSIIVQQGSFVYLLVAMGATTDQAGAVSLSSLALLVLFGAAGALWEVGRTLVGRKWPRVHKDGLAGNGVTR